MVRKKTLKELSREIKIIGIIDIIIAFLLILLGLAALPVLLWQNLEEEMGVEIEPIPQSELIITLMIGLIGVIYLISAIGLLRLENWARIPRIVLSAFLMLNYIIGWIYYSLDVVGIILFAYQAYAYYYFTKKDTAKIF